MSKPLSVAIIERARQIISDPESWCRGSFARGRAGTSVSVRDPAARRYCAMGALILAAIEITGDATQANELAYSIAKAVSDSGSLVFINDHHGHGAVLKVFDEAIAAA
jgi:hypothetical protein